jgi:nitrogen regulatory protein P-II 1
VKQIIAIVKPYLAENVLASLVEVPLVECNVVEVRGYGRQKSYLDQYSESEYSPAFLPKVELNIFVDEEHAEVAIQKILTVARSGRMGDGKVLMMKTVPDMKTIEF